MVEANKWLPQVILCPLRVLWPAYPTHRINKRPYFRDGEIRSLESNPCLTVAVQLDKALGVWVCVRCSPGTITAALAGLGCGCPVLKVSLLMENTLWPLMTRLLESHNFLSRLFRGVTELTRTSVASSNLCSWLISFLELLFFFWGICFLKDTIYS